MLVKSYSNTSNLAPNKSCQRSLEMLEQRRLVRQQLVQAPVERILLHQRKIPAEQIPHRALLEPLPVQAPLAARIDQPITHQRLQDVLPARTFAESGKRSAQNRSNPSCS